uniref:Uncharacterized protein n=1 Tax=Candidatus Kentrum sp. FW TaxID=2126338 RepID=A0A450TRL1_9GAMM|nr:MAG: hypothetical protein BECKFW1821C_GA0114237_102434 [Candidatus Kentron sp. FW]
MDYFLGVISLLIKLIYDRLASGEGGADYRQYSGQWHGCHVTADPDTGVATYSNHIYQLRVKKNGRISGSLSDLISEQPWDYSTSGNIYPGMIMMIHRGKQRPEILAVEIYKTALNPRRMVGMIFASTYEKDIHFISPIVLSRDHISDEEFREMMKNQTAAFYGDLDQTLGLPQKE